MACDRCGGRNSRWCPACGGDRAALVAAVLAAPDDDTPRLVLADWLDEHGEPGRAALIRFPAPVLFRRDPAAPAAGLAWVPRPDMVAEPPPGLAPGATLRMPDEPEVWEVVVRRGFAEAVAGPAAGLLTPALDGLLARFPIRSVRLTTWPASEHPGVVALGGRVVVPEPPAAEDPWFWRAVLAARWPRVRAWYLPPGPEWPAPSAPGPGPAPDLDEFSPALPGGPPPAAPAHPPPDPASDGTIPWYLVEEDR